MQSITVQALKERLDEGGSNVVLVDVREPFEFEAKHISGAKNIPLSTLADHLTELQNVTVYTQCQLGGRSARACAFLSEQGVSAINVEGGIVAWEQAGFAVEE